MNEKMEESSKNSQMAKKNEQTRRPNERKHDRRPPRGEGYNKYPNRNRGAANYSPHSKTNVAKLRDIKVEETTEDIQQDAQRIEKEIRLIIDEIKSLKL